MHGVENLLFEPEIRSRHDEFLISPSPNVLVVGLVGISGTLLFSDSASIGFGSVVFPVVSEPLDPLVDSLTSSSVDSI